jgi:hypothetical protein
MPIGKVMDDKRIQCSKHDLLIFLIYFGITIDVRLLQFLKANEPIVKRDDGRVIDFKLIQFSKLDLPILVKPSGNVIEVNELQL